MSAHGTRAFLDKKKSGKTCSLGLLDDQTFLTLSFFLFFFFFFLAFLNIWPSETYVVQTDFKTPGNPSAKSPQCWNYGYVPSRIADRC